MRRMSKKGLILLALAISLAPSRSYARLVRFVVEQKRPLAAETSFGSAGAYERLDGTAYFEVDPKDPLNAIIVNIDRAPRNARGMVEFSAPFSILKPVDLSKGNHKIFFGITNRGNKQAISYFNFGPGGAGGNNPLTAADLGDGFLMRLGYTIVETAWEGDLVPGGGRLVPKFPVATQPDGRPIFAAVRIEYSDRTIPDKGTFTLPLEGAANFAAYPAADTSASGATLTVRADVRGKKTVVPSDQWAFGTCTTGKGSLLRNDSNICLFDGFRADRLYELSYQAKNPIVMGLAYAVTRDVASFLRYETEDAAGNSNPLGGITRAYSFGGSQAGEYQREFIYLGFNEDESHRKAFDGVWVHKSGTHRLFANVEFADPNTYSLQDDRHDFLGTSYPPFTYAVTTDPVSKIRDGLSKRRQSDPLIFQTDSESEFWEMKASLNVVDGRGNAVPIPDNVRLYFLSSLQHGGNNPPRRFPGDKGMCENATNPVYHGPTLRALLMALDAWADKGVKPPDSNYPTLNRGTLVSLADARNAFPKISGVAFPPMMNELELLDFGPAFKGEGGRLAPGAPKLGPRYNVYVPKANEDGLDVGGVRPLEVRVPIGTHTGWNVRAKESRGPNLCALDGSFIAFARTKEERAASGDPRKSLEERYGSHDGYVKAVSDAAKALVTERFLLDEDAARFLKQAETAPWPASAGSSR
jgi:alpha/beta hydrolase family protein